MSRTSPLLSQHQQAEALLATYGPPDAGVAMVQTFGEVELEYAALRRPVGCGLIDLPNRATIEITGADRVDFLNRMVTQELKGWPELSARETFWLSRKGRIDADLRLINLPDRVLVDVDVHAAERARTGLAAYVITEACNLFDRTNEFHRLALHGATAAAVLDAASAPIHGPGVRDLAPGQVAARQFGPHVGIIDRSDTAGTPGFGLLLPTEGTRAVYEHLLELGGYDGQNGHAPGSALQPKARGHALRPIGWAAFNIARIEAGTPMYFLDFGPDSLPAETGVLSQRVSFTKGCYLGQEIVARMHALGHPKQQLVAIRLPAPTLPPPVDPGQPYEPPAIPQPVTGAAIFLRSADQSAPPRPSEAGDAIGAVTSSCVSPMLGQTPIAFAMIKFAHASAGTGLWVECEGTLLPAEVQPALASWSRA